MQSNFMIDKGISSTSCLIGYLLLFVAVSISQFPEKSEWAFRILKNHHLFSDGLLSLEFKGWNGNQLLARAKEVTKKP
ncbi:hypothetical protein AS030_02400 [Fictibacillus enclensis]|uniref:Uncharacterized protein n=1 Tax=Fictibacillus enclensis TaxID=1017270 RepID=A0A0V8JC48_9BACL|nr:hypothetical protein AS030_02400 [Fictibacillus enclensis]